MGRGRRARRVGPAGSEVPATDCDRNGRRLQPPLRGAGARTLADSSYLHLARGLVEKTNARPEGYLGSPQEYRGRRVNMVASTHGNVDGIRQSPRLMYCLRSASDVVAGSWRKDKQGRMPTIAVWQIRDRERILVTTRSASPLKLLPKLDAKPW